MKKVLFLISAVLILTSITAQAQTQTSTGLDYNMYQSKFKSDYRPVKVYHNEALKTIIIYSTSIILNGVGDGLNNNNQKTWGHACNAASIGVLLASPFIMHYEKSKWWMYILDYGFLRYSLFDASYNIANGQRIDYIGTTAGTDIIFHKAPAGYRNFTKGISLIVGISLPINEIKKINRNN